MLFYLQTTCIIVAMIHMWIQPYQNEFLNALDGVMLLLIVLVVNINTVVFLKDWTVEIIAVILVIFPLILLSIIFVRKMIFLYARNYMCHHQHHINDDDQRLVVDEDIIWYVLCM